MCKEATEARGWAGHGEAGADPDGRPVDEGDEGMKAPFV